MRNPPRSEGKPSPPAQPPVGPQLGQVEDKAGPPQRPARRPSFLQQVEQRRLGGRVDAAWDPATQPQPSFPSTSMSLTAISLSASDNRATSAFACSNSTSRSRAFTPGRDAANAANAPSLATVRIRMMVDRST